MRGALAVLIALSGAQFWYYCNNPPGYYPYVSYCVSYWQRVPASSAPGMPR